MQPRRFFFKVSMQNDIEAVIEVRGLSKRVKDATGEFTILDRIDLSIAKGSSVAIVGASGSGKSTLLGLLAGLDNASEGSVRLLGRDLSTLNEDERAALRSGAVGFVFQSFQLMPHLTALENVMLPLELRAEMPHADFAARAFVTHPAVLSLPNPPEPRCRDRLRDHRPDVRDEPPQRRDAGARYARCRTRRTLRRHGDHQSGASRQRHERLKGCLSIQKKTPAAWRMRASAAASISAFAPCARARSARRSTNRVSSDRRTRP